MINKKKPYLQKYSENEWEFIYPASIGNEKIYNEYWKAVELLDYEDNKTETILKRLIYKYPFFIDAYNHLSISFRNQNKTFESLLTAEKSYLIGKECFPKNFNYKTDKLIWAVLENRPFLRACQIYGLECQYHNDYLKAIDIYKENLKLNKNDNQGIRYLLLEVYFLTKNYKEARKLINSYLDDWSIEFKYGLIVLNVLDGRIKQADEILNDAIKVNNFLIEEIIKEKHTQPRISGKPNFNAGIPLGSIQQAYEHWKRNKKIYSKKEIIEYFKSKKNGKIS